MIKTDHNIKEIFLIGYERDSSKHEADDFKVQNDDKIMFLVVTFYEAKENAPPAIKQYKNHGVRGKNFPDIHDEK